MSREIGSFFFACKEISKILVRQQKFIWTFAADCGILMMQDNAIRCRERSYMNKQQHYKAALYCRLSVDDGNYGGCASVSIETQKVLLEQYCKDHSITDYTFYCGMTVCQSWYRCSRHHSKRCSRL